MGQQLLDLETSFVEMLPQLLDLLAKYKCDISKVKFFLNSLLDTKEFGLYESFNTISILQQLSSYYDFQNLLSSKTCGN